MRFGTVCMWRDNLSAYKERVVLAEQLGFEVIADGDTQSVYRDVYVGLAVSAGITENALIGPMVTNAVTRHPAVTASAMAAVDELSGGRAIIGFGSGDSAVRNLKTRPARLVEMESYLRAIQDLQDTGRATWQDKQIAVQNLDRRIPIWMTAEGPKTLALAGRLVDTVVLHSGSSDESIAWSLAQLHRGAEEAGRDPASIGVWMMLKTSVGDTHEEAIAGVKMGLAGSAHHAYRHSLSEKGVPPELIPAVEELCRRYDTTDHEIAYGRNANLSDELGLTDFLADSFGLIGTAPDCVAKLKRMEAAGVDGVILPAIGPDPLDLLTRVGRDIMPSFARQAAASAQG